MDVYQTEEQQVDAIKKFWKENGTGIIAGLVIGFSSFIGYGLYTKNVAEQELITAEKYQSLVDELAADSKDATASAQQFISENAESSYASLTALSLAKKASEHKDWAQVATYLQQAIDTASSDAIKAIATTRLARVQIELDQVDEALATLAAPMPAAFNASVDEIKGDAYLAQGKKDLARNAYQLAIAASGENVNPSLQMKLDDLAEIVNLNSVTTVASETK